MAGRRPVAASTVSAETVCSAPLWVNTTAGPGSMRDTEAPVNTSTPDFFSSMARPWDSSRSRLATSRSRASTMVIWHPAAAQTAASSTPITPPPMITMRFRGRMSAKSSSLVTTPGVSSPGMGGRAGTEPAAIRIFRAS